MYKGTGKKINSVVATLIAMDFVSCCVLAVDVVVSVICNRWMDESGCVQEKEDGE